MPAAYSRGGFERVVFFDPQSALRHGSAETYIPEAYFASPSELTGGVRLDAMAPGP